MIPSIISYFKALVLDNSEMAELIVRDDYSSDSEAHILLVSDESAVWDSDGTSEVSVYDKSRGNEEIPVKKVVVKVYKRRWLILGLFSLLSFMQVWPIL